MQSNSVILFGGSFNPVHYGHLRLAVEVFEAVKPERLDFIPCANPPHKPGLGLLPFEMRVRMLREVCSRYPQFCVNTLEAEREGPSYTCDTLQEYRREYPAARLYFVLGSEDYVNLDTWKGWKSLPELAEILVVPRQGVEEDEFIEHTCRLWPEAAAMDELPAPARAGFLVGNGGRVVYLPLPRLDINASMVRRRWLNGRMIDFWVPGEVVDGLAVDRSEVEKFWR